MPGFWGRLFGRRASRTHDTGSAKSARERLQFVLLHDRISLPPEQMQAMKAEIIAVISKYVHVASNTVDIALERRDNNQSVMRAEIPFFQSSDSQVSTDEAVNELKSGEGEPSKISTASVFDEEDELGIEDSLAATQLSGSSTPPSEETQPSDKTP